MACLLGLPRVRVCSAWHGSCGNQSMIAADLAWHRSCCNQSMIVADLAWLRLCRL